MKAVIKDPTLLLLIAANLLTIFLALTQNWNLLTIMWIYWAQSMIIGFIYFFKILGLKEFSTEGFIIGTKQAEPTEETKVFTAWITIAVYCGLHFTWAFLMFFVYSNFEVDYFFVFIMALVFLVNHLTSYYFYRNKQPIRKPRLIELQAAPFYRIIPMHGIVFFFMGILGPTNPGVILLFLLLKTAADVIMHIKEHKRQWA